MILVWASIGNEIFRPTISRVDPRKGQEGSSNTRYSTHANTITTHPTKMAPHCCHSNRSAIQKSMFLLLLTTSDHQWCWYMGSINPFAGVHSVRNMTVLLAPVSLVQGDHTVAIVTQANCIMCIYFAFQICVRPIKLLLQCFQALVHSQSISQYRDARIFNFILFKTVKESTCTPELVQVVNGIARHSVKVTGTNS